jgi:hypothetical protein
MNDLIFVLILIVAFLTLPNIFGWTLAYKFGKYRTNAPLIGGFLVDHPFIQIG